MQYPGATGSRRDQWPAAGIGFEGPGAGREQATSKRCAAASFASATGPRGAEEGHCRSARDRDPGATPRRGPLGDGIEIGMRSLSD